jgi:hypothetical protein
MRSHASKRRLPVRHVLVLAALALLLLSGLLVNAVPAQSATRKAAHVKAHKALTCRTIRLRLAHHHKLRTHRARVKWAACKRAAAHHRAIAHKRAVRQQQQQAQQQSSSPAPAPATPASAAVAAVVASTPPPAVRGGTQGWNGYGVGSWPGADWRPYAATSPFNQPIPGSASVHPNSANIVREVLSWAAPGSLIAGSAGTTSDYGHPTYWSQPNDPRYKLHSTSGSPAIEGMTIPVPSAAKPAGGSDAHMTIVTPDGWEYDLWDVQSKPTGGGTLTFGIGGRTRIDGNGTNSPATASNFANLAGVIRAQELAAGHINHALFIAAKCTTTSTAFGFGARDGSGSQAAYVYPATHGGSGCGDANAPPMGARFQLNMSDAQIAALNVPDWKKTILTALAHYGGYVGDTGGPGFAFEFESSEMYLAFGYADPLVTFAKANGIVPQNGFYAFNMATGVDWAHYLRVVVPPGS